MWKWAGMFAGVSVLVALPWYLKAIFFTGNPVYPFFYSIFGGRDWSADLARNYSILQARFGMGHDFSSFMLLPYNLTFHSDAFYDTAGLYVGPLLAAAVPVLVLGRYRSRKLAGLVGFFLAQVVVWFALSQQSRYLIPAFATLAVVVSAVLYQEEKLRVARAAFWAVAVATGVFGLWSLWPLVTSAAPVAAGLETRDAYLARTLDIYPAQKWMNENLPGDARVALYGDTRGFYLDRDYVWADPGHNLAFSRDFRNPRELARYLRSRCITHVMINFRFFPAHERAGKTGRFLYEAIDAGLLRQVYPPAGGAARVCVYRLRQLHDRQIAGWLRQDE